MASARDKKEEKDNTYNTRILWGRKVIDSMNRQIRGSYSAEFAGATGDASLSVKAAGSAWQFTVWAKNTSSKPVEIDWAAATVVDYAGVEHKVRHSAAVPAVIKAGEEIIDSAVPADNMWYDWMVDEDTTDSMFPTEPGLTGRTATLRLPVKGSGEVVLTFNLVYKS